MNKYLKLILSLLATLLLAWFLVRRGIHWNDLQSVLRQAHWGWLSLALAWEAAAYGAVTRLNEILLQRYGIKVSFAKQYVVQLAMAFIEAAVPSASISGVVLRARLLKPHGVSADMATATTLAESTLIFASVVLLSLPMAGIAMLNGIAGFSGLVRWLFLMIGIVVSIGITIWQWNVPRFAHFRTRQLQGMVRFWERHIQPRWPRYFGDWPAQRVIERLLYLWSETVASLSVHPYSIFLSLLARFGFEALSLMMCFYALGQSLPIATLILLYALSIAINTIGAVLPGGVGLAEVSLSALYAQFGIPTEAALAIALAYRMTGYWFPRVAGGVALLWIEREEFRRGISESPL